MNETELNIIGDFLNKKLTADEQKAFERRLSNEAELKAEFDKIALLKQIAERNRIIEQARNIHKKEIELLQKPKGRLVSLPKIGGLAAAACLVFAIYLGSSDFDYVYISNVERGEKSSENSLNDFEKGVGLLKDNQPKQAIGYFRRVQSNSELRAYYKDAARWYEVVALTEMNKDEEAKTLLNQIENSAGFKYKISWIEKMKMKVRLWF
jgi:hypothetical protein